MDQEPEVIKYQTDTHASSSGACWDASANIDVALLLLCFGYHGTRALRSMPMFPQFLFSMVKVNPKPNQKM